MPNWTTEETCLLHWILWVTNYPVLWVSHLGIKPSTFHLQGRCPTNWTIGTAENSVPTMPKCSVAQQWSESNPPGGHTFWHTTHHICIILTSTVLHMLAIAFCLLAIVLVTITHIYSIWLIGMHSRSILLDPTNLRLFPFGYNDFLQFQHWDLKCHSQYDWDTVTDDKESPKVHHLKW